MRPDAARAHPDHQQPMGWSAGVCRRRSSRLAGVGASAAMRGAVVASKRATAAAAVASQATLAVSDSVVCGAAVLSRAACAWGRRERLRLQACMQGTEGVLQSRKKA